jgi:hypothetical protein
VETAVERLTGPDEDVGGRAEPPQQAVRSLGHAIGRLGELAEDHQQVVVAVRARIPSGARAEQIDPFGLKARDQPPDDLGEDRVGIRAPGAHLHGLNSTSTEPDTEQFHGGGRRRAGAGTLAPADDARGPATRRLSRVGRAPRVSGSCGPYCTMKLVVAAPVSAPFRVALAPAW